MKKLISIALCAIMALSITSCGGTSNNSSAVSTPPIEVSLDSALEEIKKVNNISNEIDIDDFCLEYDMTLTMDNIDSFVGCKSNDNGNCGTIVLIKAKDGKAADVVKELEAFKTYQADYYGGYAEFAQAQELIEDGIVYKAGDIAALVFANTDGADYGEIENTLRNVLG